MLNQLTQSFECKIGKYLLLRDLFLYRSRYLIFGFAEIYWETKGIATKKVKAPYKPGEEVVYPAL